MTVWVAVALSVLATVIASLAGRGSVAANGLVGIRTPALRSSDAAWRAGHRAAVPILAALTVVSAAAGVVVFAATWGKGADVTNMAGLWVIGLVVTAIVLAAVRANAVAASSDPETH
ncbi:SdpI family protein [Frigoribacterium sp. VKM Ac-2530]|nr:SdpI family protein [Frigoribacterium sp. VKM Ac-2530]